MKQKNSVLITGVAGFLGHHLGMHLLEQGIPVRGIDALTDRYDSSLKKRNLAALRETAADNGASFSFEELDLLDRSALSSFFGSYRADRVVHLAAATGRSASLEEPSRFLRTNVRGTSNLLDQLADQKPDKVLYVSSSAVYGNQPEVPFQEDTNRLNPVSPYGVSKRAAELLCRAFQKQQTEVNLTVVRPFTIFGPRSRPNTFLYQCAERIENGEPVPAYESRNVLRDFTYVSDAVEGLSRALFWNEPWSVFNLGSGHGVTVDKLVEELATALDTVAERNTRSFPEGEVPQRIADMDYTEQELGFEPEVEFENGIRRFVDWFENRELL